MMNDLLKAALWVIGIVVAVYLIGKAIVESVKIATDGQLAAIKAEQEYNERMFDKAMSLHQKIFGSAHSYLISPHDDIKPNA